MKPEPLAQSKPGSPQFIADSTLGKLAKWLRLAGFDTLYDRHPPDVGRLAAAGDAKNRIVLTRSQKVKRCLTSKEVVFIHNDQPAEQIYQVVRDLHLQPQDLHPLTRCARCNAELTPVVKEDIQSLVPEYIWQIHTSFHKCSQCHRIYWPGSHAQRWLNLMKQWFEDL